MGDVVRDGGKAVFCRLKNTAPPGAMPVEKLEEVGRLWFAWVDTGAVRYYAASGANRQYDAVIWCLNTVNLPEGAAYVIIPTGEQYRIDRDQARFSENALELTLVRLENFYDLITE